LKLRAAGPFLLIARTRLFISDLFDEFVEFSGDRRCADASASVALGAISWLPIMVVATKGRDQTTRDRNFGSVQSLTGYRKALRVMSWPKIGRQSFL